ncbi:hypothetical protein QPK87_28285 [Kamptonema cortianum]|nr:hypothetical protein [Geitlerinema splendidum]MDK3160426.1 hypothetical protein [Kamptonema cortianum]
MVGAVTVSRFTIPAGKEREYESMLLSFGDEVREDRGYVSTSVWHDVVHQDRYLRITAFENWEALEKSYQEMVDSGFLVEAVEKWGVAPDVIRCVPAWSHRFSFKDIHDSEFLSLSIRALDPGFGSDWVNKLKNNFREVSLIPGFEGAWVGTTDILPDQVTGIVLWQDEASFKRSVPADVEYQIDLYSAYR